MSEVFRNKKSRRLEGNAVLERVAKAPRSAESEQAPQASARQARQTEIDGFRAHIRTMDTELFESKKHMNHVVALLKYLSVRSEENPDGFPVATIISASQVLRRFFVLYLRRNEFSLYSASQRHQAELNKSAVGKIQEWLATQLKKYVAAMLAFVAFAQRDDVPNALQIAAIDSVIDVAIVAAGTDTQALSALDAYAPLPQLLIAIAAEPQRPTEVTAHFTVSWLDRYDDLRVAVLRALYKLVAGGGVAHEAFAAIPVVTALSDAGALSAPAIHENVFALLCDVKPNHLSNAVCVPAAKPVKPADALARQKKFLSDAWLALLKHPFSAEGYKRVLLAAETVIIPAVQNPVALADFLTDSYNLGGIASVLALGGLFVLITKHSLEYPNFFPKLYSVCDITAVTARYRTRFFSLISLVLSGSYLPSYLVAAFAKRLCRLSLLAPPPAATFVLALVFNLIRKHPMISSLVNRSMVVQRGNLKPSLMPAAEFGKLYRLDGSHTVVDNSAEAQDSHEDVSGQGAAAAAAEAEASKQAARPMSLFAAIDRASGAAAATSQAVAATSAASAALGGLILGSGNTIQATSIEIGKIVNSAPLLVKSAATATEDGMFENHDGVQVTLDAEAWLEGKDPFVEFTNDPAAACALQSSLLEIQALCEHYCPDVARLAKMFFAETAPKVGHDIALFTSHSYANIFEYEIMHKKNRIVPKAFEKPITLLGRSARPLTADEKFDDEARARVAAINKMPGVLETIFSA